MSDPDATTRPVSPAEAGEPRTVESPRAPGEQIGRFVVLEKLGEGGMGTVYAAHDPVLHRRVAIKLMRREMSGPLYGARMVREAQALAKLSHPNVVSVHDVGQADGRMFLAMEHIEGRALSDVFGDRLPWPRVLELFCEAGRGLAAAHAAGLIHRDFKPQNTMLGTDGRVRVLDFGLARDSGETAPDSPLPGHGTPSGPLTRAGTVMGTTSYMSPEQLEGQPCDSRTDQFSFCVSLWEGLYAELPFEQGSRKQQDIPTRKDSEPKTASWAALPETPRKGVPAHVHQALLRGLQVDREARFPSMDALLAMLAPRSRRYPIALVYGLAAVTALISVAVVVDQLHARTPKGWWARHKASCNPVRVTGALQEARRPGGPLSAGGPAADVYASACLALAGRFDEAQKLAAGLPPAERQHAAHLFYVLGAPTDDVPAARVPEGQVDMMELALENSTPRSDDHWRAAYYVAFSALEAGDLESAKQYLEYFVRVHPGDDPWRTSALTALGSLGGKRGADAQ